MPWLLMTWWHKEPGHQHQWYWPSFPRTSWTVFCLLLGVSSDCAQPITGQVTEVTCPVIAKILKLYFTLNIIHQLYVSHCAIPLTSRAVYLLYPDHWFPMDEVPDQVMITGQNHLVSSHLQFLSQYLWPLRTSDSSSMIHNTVLRLFSMGNRNSHIDIQSWFRLPPSNEL